MSLFAMLRTLKDLRKGLGTSGSSPFQLPSCTFISTLLPGESAPLRWARPLCFLLLKAARWSCVASSSAVSCTLVRMCACVQVPLSGIAERCDFCRTPQGEKDCGPGVVWEGAYLRKITTAE